MGLVTLAIYKNSMLTPFTGEFAVGHLSQ